MGSLVGPLAAAGFSVQIPVLPGHGGVPDDLDGIHWTDWLDSVQAEYRALRGRHRRVVVVGQSLGGALVRLLLGEVQPPAAAVILAMPMRINSAAARSLAPILDRVPPLTQRLAWVKDGGSDIADPVGRYPKNMYIWTPMQAVCELHKILTHQARTVNAAPCPTLLIHSENDHTAEYAGALKLKAKLGKNASLLTLQRSYHVLTQDVEQAEVAEAVAAFVSKS